MSDPTTGDEAQEEVPAEAPADEAAEVDFGDEEGGTDPILAAAQEARMHTRAAWSLVPSQVFTLLFANILFFAGALADWSRSIPGDPWNPAIVTNGLDWIRGSVIFALAIYGFWTCAFNIWHRQMKVWPFLINALLGLWVGLGTIISKIGSDDMDKAVANMKAKPSSTLMDQATYRLGVIAPGPWLLTLGGIVVLIVLIRGVMSGAAAAKASGRRR